MGGVVCPIFSLFEASYFLPFLAPLVVASLDGEERCFPFIAPFLRAMAGSQKGTHFTQRGR